ncbi:MAG: hypothetical protein AMJ88_12740 [Anaerolineae bacterium SM23_ 63]|nr:MAG: hypothetical protein AMJ88_12740 [Anaerolineae bacterium SM23_ 63]
MTGPLLVILTGGPHLSSIHRIDAAWCLLVPANDLPSFPLEVVRIIRILAEKGSEDKSPIKLRSKTYAYLSSINLGVPNLSPSNFRIFNYPIQISTIMVKFRIEGCMQVLSESRKI